MDGLDLEVLVSRPLVCDKDELRCEVSAPVLGGVPGRRSAPLESLVRVDVRRDALCEVLAPWSDLMELLVDVGETDLVDAPSGWPDLLEVVVRFDFGEAVLFDFFAGAGGSVICNRVCFVWGVLV